MKRLENKVAIVTAASKGIGLSCAEKLAENGATVYLAVRRLEETQKICDKFKSKNYKMTPVFFDATDKSSFSTMVNEIISNESQIDILVNNFGIGKPEDDLDLVNGNTDSFFKILELNIGSVYLISKLVIPYMLNDGGSIINISSIGGIIPDISRTGYGVSKAAINNLTQQIAVQYARNNIRCNAVLPGLTATEAVSKNMPEKFIKSFLSHVPLNRMGTPEDIANAVLFLSSPDSSYITGHILDVAGGYGIGTPQFADNIRATMKD